MDLKSLQRPKKPDLKLIESLKSKNKITVTVKEKPKKNKIKKNKIENNQSKILYGNGFHKAVGVINGVLKSSIKTVIGDKEKIKLKVYKLYINDDVSVKANLIFGARLLAENKSELILNNQHSFIVYPKYNKKGEFYVDIIAFDDEKKSEIYKLCNDKNFIIVGIGFKDKIIVQENQNKKTKKIKKFKYDLDFNNHNLNNGVLYQVLTELNVENMKLKVCQSQVYDINT